MRVFISGVGLVSSLGNNVDEMFSALEAGRSGVVCNEDWKQYKGLSSYLMAPAHKYDSKKMARQIRRSMSPMSEMAVLATLQALDDAGFEDGNFWQNSGAHRTSVIMGSTTGSPITMEEHFKKLFERGGPESMLSTAFFKIMNHSVAANVALALGYQGPLSGISSACSTSTQAIVQGWELIHSGLYDVVVVGGADELHYTTPSTFNTVQAASTQYNDHPEKSPRPFDKDRDGLVVSEGAGVLVLESEKHLRERGKKPQAELLGGAYICDGQHMSHPSSDAISKVMSLALERSQITSDKIDYVNAHATATMVGDIQEARGIYNVFKDRVPVSSLKGHFGHSLAACGAHEIIAGIEMMKKGVCIATRNLEAIDPECKMINLPQSNIVSDINHFVCNNFAFGGMNVSLVIGSGEGL